MAHVTLVLPIVAQVMKYYFKPSDKEEAKTLKLSNHFIIMNLSLFMLDLAFSNHVNTQLAMLI